MMQPLDRGLRNQLERSILTARETAEAAAKAALEHLSVADPNPPKNGLDYLGETGKTLRRRLRAHGRQLGDALNGDKNQSMDRLVEEVAYEQWHRMLFARFLAENNLLMYPDPVDPVPVSLGECEELARDEGAANGWELAARYAARMLPQIFRLDSPVFQLSFPPEHQQRLERLVAALPGAVFTAPDSLGWVYQFWQSKRKDEVNRSERKIGARELPAVTQLFTEPYMVSFLLDNALGAWWAGRRLSEDDLRNANSEEELRRKAAIPGVPLEYLRFVNVEAASSRFEKSRDGASLLDQKRQDGASTIESNVEAASTMTPAAGTFEDWPEDLSDLKVLDPCCGSGHFLVAAFLMLVPMRMEREGLSAREAVDAVLRENLHGLELDQRCVELAAFALALAAWKYPNAGGYRALPELNVACSGLPVTVSKSEWKAIARGDEHIGWALDKLHDAFQDAPLLGSLLDPTQIEAARILDRKQLRQLRDLRLVQEQPVEQQEVTVVAQGLAKTAALLADQYHWVITNVPYLARGKQHPELQEFCAARYPRSKNDLATVFLERCLDRCVQGGVTSVVLPQNWLFLTSYKKLRKHLLQEHTWHLIARLGPKGFQTPMWDFNVQLLTLSRGNKVEEASSLFANTHKQHDAKVEAASSRFEKQQEKDIKRLEAASTMHGLDVSELRSAAEKATALLDAEIQSVSQARQLKNPDARVTLEEGLNQQLLEDYVFANQGIKTGDDNRWRQFFWEINGEIDFWHFYQGTVNDFQHYSGREAIINWKYEGVGMPCRRPTNRNVGNNVLPQLELESPAFRLMLTDWR